MFLEISAEMPLLERPINYACFKSVSCGNKDTKFFFILSVENIPISRVAETRNVKLNFCYGCNEGRSYHLVLFFSLVDWVNQSIRRTKRKPSVASCLKLSPATPLKKLLTCVSNRANQLCFGAALR